MIVGRRNAIILVVALLVAAVAGSRSTAAQVTPSITEAWATFDSSYTVLSPQTNFLAAEVVDGGCRPVHGVNADQRLAVGSTFKLYVLGELARQIEAGLAAWDEQLPVQERLKSKLSGGTLFEPAGTMHTLRHYAERMIAESDNTATDHLIDRLGRENVEAALPLFGHGAPELNTPFLTTREFFTFKIAVPADRVDAYLAAADDEQRRILETEVDPLPIHTYGYGDWVAPRRIDSVEWFASATEVCAALATLHEMADRPGLSAIDDILALNRGGVFDPGTWPYAGYKGGYEAGVFNLTWLLRRHDDRVFVVTAGFNDPINYVNQAAVGQFILLAEDLLARAP